MTSYIVIEIAENENALEILSLLISQTKARFTHTRNIGEYAAEREQLRKSKPEEKSVTKKLPTPSPVDATEPPKKKRMITPINAPESPPHDFESILQKLEETTPPRSALESILEATQSWSTTQSHQSVFDQDLTITSSPSTTKPPYKRLNDTFQCNICGAFIKAYHLDYYKRSNHAIVHTSLQRYVCPVSGCGIKTRHRSNMVVHARTVHGLQGKVNVENCLLPHEDEELKQTVLACFPEMAKTIENMQKREKKLPENEFEGGADIGNEAESDGDDDNLYAIEV